MDSLAENFCRTCLSSQSLYPIFRQKDDHEKYTNILLAATGQKVVLNDSLPQQMCSVCISYVNSVTKFWKKCQETHIALIKIARGGNLVDIINETHNICVVNVNDFTQIDISASIFVNGIRNDANGDVNSDVNNYLNPISTSPNDDDQFDDEDNVCLDTLALEKNSSNLLNEKKHTDELKSHKNDGIEKITNNETDRTTNAKVKIKRQRNTDVNTSVEEIDKNCKRKKICKKKNGQQNGEENEKDVKENGVKKKKIEKKVTVVCNVCNAVFSSKRAHRTHYKRHEGFKVVCEHCGKKFVGRYFLQMHCRAKHGYERKDKCSYCDYMGTNPEQVKIHERIHTGEKPYQCGVCGARFSRNSCYQQHVAIHLPDKTVLCERCPARFKSYTLMRIHARNHLPPKYVFKCHVCENKFSRPRNVLRHLFKIHNVVGTKDNYTREKIS